MKSSLTHDLFWVQAQEVPTSAADVFWARSRETAFLQRYGDLVDSYLEYAFAANPQFLEQEE